MPTLEYSIRFQSNLKYNDKIRNTITGSKELKAQINKTLQRANRRIQNLNSSNKPSPALKALASERDVTSRFSVFSIGNIDTSTQYGWLIAKEEYARALAFLNNPTSSVTGTKTYINRIADKYKINKDVAERVIDKASDPILLNDSRININAYKYRAVIEQIINTIFSTANNMNANAEMFEQNLENQIEDLTQSTIENYIAVMNNSISGIFK